jgi:hypothetical protein
MANESLAVWFANGKTKRMAQDLHGGLPIPISVSLTENIVRAGVNYKFSW